MSSIFKNFLYKFTLTFFKVISPLLVMPYVFRQIVPEKMGEINFVLAILTYFYIVGDLGLYVYSMREVSKRRNNKEAINRFFTETFILRFVINTCASIAYYITYKIYFNESLHALFFVGFINMAAAFINVEGFFEGVENFKFLTLRTLIVRIISIILIFMFVNGSDANYWYLIINGGFLFVNNLASFVVFIRKHKFDFNNFKPLKHIYPQINIFLMINAYMLFFLLDKTFLGIYASIVEVGYYTLVEKVLLITTGFILSVTQVTTPRLVIYRENSANYSSLLKNTTNILSLLIFPISIGLAVLSKEIVFLFGGHEYEQASFYLQLFSIYVILFTLIEILKTQVLFVHNKEKKYTGILFIGLTINIIIKIFFLSELDLTIAILSTEISLILTLFFLLRASKKILNYSLLSTNSSLKYLFYSIPISIVILINFENVFLNLLIKISLGFIIYFATLVLFKEQILLQLFQKVKTNATYQKFFAKR